MKLNKTMSKILTNKLVLNIVAALAFLNILGYLLIGNINAVLYFIIFGLLISYFSKNMIIVLGVPFLIVNLLVYRGSIIEGMDNINKSRNPAKANRLKNKYDDNHEDNIEEGMETNDISSKNKTDKLAKLNKSNEKSRLNTVINSAVASEQIDANVTKDGFESGRRKHNKYNIDYASTIEDAYDELNNILGSDGIQRLTADTQKLMGQQMQLAEAMKSMGPMMQTLSPMVTQLKDMMGEGGMNNIMNLAKNFGNGQQK